MRKFFLITFGCRLNQAESQDLEQLLVSFGFKKTIHLNKADLVVINSCVVTEKAEREVRQAIYQTKRKNQKAKIVVAGCWVDKIKLFGGKKPKGIDFVVENKEKWQGLVESRKLRAKSLVGSSGLKNIRRLIKIQSGCENGCSFCLARLVRGKPKSIPIKKIVEKVSKAVRNGALEVVLTGQNVSQFDDCGNDWIDLIEEILKRTKVRLLRLGSINPQMSDGQTARLIKIFNGVGKGRLARHLHLSLQSGSDKILKLMNRNYTAKQYFKLVKNLKLKIRNLSITTDIIVGFPGETEEDFQKTLKLCEKIGFGKIHIFRYSTRPGTLAAKMENAWGRADVKTKIERAKRLAEIEKKLRLKFWQSQRGKKAMAIIWKSGGGLSDNYIPITVEVEKIKSLPAVAEIKFIELRDNFLYSCIIDRRSSK